MCLQIWLFRHFDVVIEPRDMARPMPACCLPSKQCWWPNMQMQSWLCWSSLFRDCFKNMVGNLLRLDLLAYFVRFVLKQTQTARLDSPLWLAKQRAQVLPLTRPKMLADIPQPVECATLEVRRKRPPVHRLQIAFVIARLDSNLGAAAVKVMIYAPLSLHHQHSECLQRAGEIIRFKDVEGDLPCKGLIITL